MKDRHDFVENIEKFFESEDNRVLLVTGLDDDEKIRMVLSKLNERYKRGTFYVNGLGNATELLNRAFGNNKKMFTKNINKKDVYSIGNMNLVFKKYSEELYGGYLSENDEFAIYYPVQIALMDEKLFKKLTAHIQVTRAFKTIIVTTNDQHTDTSKLKPFIDKHIHYETKNDNEELYRTVKSNLKGLSRRLELNPIYNELIE